VLIAGDIGIGLILTIVVLAYRRRTPTIRPRHSDTVGEVAKAVLASFALAVLLVEGVFPGAWLIVAYSLYGGPLEDRLPLGASIGSVLRAMAIGLVISTYAGISSYIALFLPSRRR